MSKIMGADIISLAWKHGMQFATIQSSVTKSKSRTDKLHGEPAGRLLGIGVKFRVTCHTRA